jgi:hypothetical protein
LRFGEGAKRIDLAWTSEPTSDRYEIFDADVYITTFNNEPPSTRFPESFTFGRSFFIYGTAFRRFDLHFPASSPKMISIHPEGSNELVLERVQ